MPDWLRRYLQPREGWLSAFLLLVMALCLVWSVQAAGWLARMEFLTPIAFYAVLAGTLLGISRLSVVATLPLGAVVGVLSVLWIVGGEYFPGLGGARLVALRDDAINWIQILIAQGFAPQLTPYAIGLGLVLWITAFMAAYTLFRHHKVLDAILLLGAALIANLSSTLAQLLGYLVLFMVAALLLWLRAAQFGRQEAWQRRRVNENAEVPGAIMRSGVVFIAGSVILAWVLTGVAVAAPLTAVWNNLDTVWDGVQDRLDLVFGGLDSGESRFTGQNFGPDFRISREFTSTDEPVLTVAADRGLYLRATTYDLYTGHGWAQTPGTERDVPPEEQLFPKDAPEAPTLDAFETQTIEVAIEQPSARTLFTAGYPIKAFVPVRLIGVSDQQFLGAMQATTSIPAGGTYSLTVAVSEATIAQLRAASTSYPDAVTQLYLGTNGITQRTKDLAAQITRDDDNPYDKAQALSRFLQGNDFTYNTKAPVSGDPNRDAVDFFLFDEKDGRIGFCEHFATAMVEMARSLGIPARMAAGYAPGQRILAAPGAATSTVWQVRRRNAHAWAELYFPGYGWQIFEATKTIDPVVRLPGGGPDASSGDGQGENRTPPPFDYDLSGGKVQGLESSNPLPGGVSPTDNDKTPAGEQPSVTGANVLILLLIIGGLLGFAFWRWRGNRRQLRFLAPGDRQWRRLTLAADRAGVAQRPSETIYEYAGWLEEQLPSRGPEIRTIADGKVWHSYSGRGISGTIIAKMEDAWKRLQLPLVGLAIRRRLRGLVAKR